MNRYIVLVLLSICCLALGGIFVKLSQFPPITTGMYRVLFSLPIFFLLTKANKQEYRMNNKEKLIAICAGIFLALDLILWNISFSYTTVANANLLANLVPFTVVPISYFVYKEKISKEFILGGSIILLGVFILMGGKVNPTLDNFKGDGLAILTSVFYGLFIATVYKLRTRASTIQLMSYASIGCLLVLLPVSLLIEGVYIPYTFKDFYPLIGLALLSQILGQGGLSYCLGKVKASYASLLVLTQPVISALYAYFIFDENLSYKEILGMFVILMGLYIANKRNK
ncbi:DMT family transporter [Pelistega sp. NLN82]|uniref:DMT family transporter n=1 Tax=Pelistega ratti TaxID=2652177 RepID=A0A6L9Y4K8_9BURK|nr:DMT family transporter [Pelistega ratti]NEN75135.1 DMT family transporter [Pelistega ratti]